MTEVSSPHHLVIHASAGSGKTHQLTNRFLALLLAGARPESILTSTFTRKAAAEILDRVLERLARGALDAEARARLAEELNRPGLTQEAVDGALARVVQGLHQLQITTLDAFFARLLTCFGLELGLLPGWRIVEEIDEEQLREEALRRVLAGSRPELVRLVRRLDREAARREISAWLDDLVARLHDLYVETAPESWRTVVRPPRLVGDALASALVALEEAPVAGSGRMREAWAKDTARAKARDWLAFASAGLAKAIAAGTGLYHGKPIPPRLHERYLPLVEHARATLLTRLADQTESTYELLDEVDRELQSLKHHRASLRFADVTRALDGAAALDQLEEMFYRLDGRIEHLLLDEFQDTARSQWRVLKGLAEELAAYGDGSHTLLCVGDVKQAIYGWRGAEPGILENLTREIPSLERKPLDRTWRSSPVVIDAVNRVFSTLKQNPALAGHDSAAANWEDQFTPHETVRVEAPGYVRLEVAPRSDDPRQQTTRTLAHAADRIRALHEAAPDRVIGVLVRTRAAVAHSRYELQRLGIAASEEGGNPLTDSPAVSLVLSLLHLADHPADTVARFHVAQSPWSRDLGLHADSSYEATSRFCADIRARLLSDGYGATLLEWTKQLAPACDARNLDRLLQLVELGHEHDREVALRPGDFVSVVRRRPVEDPSSSRVRLMTIHQAKGLEFDIVVLPQLHVELAHLDAPVLVERPDPVAAPTKVVRHASSTVRAWAGLEDIHQAERERLARESLNLLYVAMTRAVNALHLILDPSPPNERRLPARMDGVLRGALSPRPGAHVRAEPESLLFEAGDPRWAERARPSMPPARPLTRPAAGPIQLATAPGERRRIWREESPSEAANRGAVPLAQRLRRTGERARQRGLALHACFAQVNWLDEERPDPARLQRAVEQAVRRTADESGRNEFVLEFLALVDRPNLAALLGRASYERRWPGLELTVWRERDFVMRRGETLVRGRYDRVVLGSEGDRVRRAHVVEFKTDRLLSGDPDRVAEAAQAYRPQMDAYRSAVAERVGLESSAVEASIAYVAEDLLYDWTASVQERP